MMRASFARVLALAFGFGLPLGCGGPSNPGEPTSGAGGSGGGSGASSSSGTGGGMPTPTGNVAWSRRGDGLGAVRAIAAAADGSVAAVGVFRDTIDFGAGPMTSAGENDGWVARFDEKGTCVWSRSFGGAGDDAANAVTIDSSGRVYVSGAFTQDIQVGSEVLMSAGSYDVPLFVFEPDGTLVSARRFGGPGFDVAYSLGAGADGRVALLGASDGPIDFGGGSLQGMGGTFVAAFNAEGAHLFSRLFDDVQGQSIAIDSNHHVAIGGSFSGILDLGTGPLSSVASTDGFVARLDPAGNPLFARRVGDGSSIFAYTVAASPSGDLVLGGMANSQGVTESFVELDRFTSAGDVMWSRKFGKAEYAAANAVAIDAWENVVVAGFVRDGALDLGCGPLASPADAMAPFAGDMFLAKLDPAGNCLWSKVFGGPGQHSAFGVAVDGAGHIVVGGEYQSAIDFGDGPLVAKHYPEPCVARFGP